MQPSKPAYPGSVWVFFALTFAISWILWIPAALTGQQSSQFPTMALHMLGGFGPSIAGIIMVYRHSTPEGRRDFWKRVWGFKRISPAWYAVIILLFPLITLLAAAIDVLLGGSGPGAEAWKLALVQPVTLIPNLIIGILFGALSEELGWRGFALDRLQMRWSALVSSLLLAGLWWFWHLPLFFILGTSQNRWGFTSPLALLFLVSIFPLSILITWVYNNTHRTILSAILLHAVYNIVFNMIYPFTVQSEGILIGIMVLVAAAVVLIFGKRTMTRT